MKMLYSLKLLDWYPVIFNDSFEVDLVNMSKRAGRRFMCCLGKCLGSQHLE